MILRIYLAAEWHVLFLLTMLSAFVTAAGALPMLCYLMLFIMDYRQGNRTAAIKWNEEFRKGDFKFDKDKQSHPEYQHEFLAVKHVVADTD